MKGSDAQDPSLLSAQVPGSPRWRQQVEGRAGGFGTTFHTLWAQARGAPPALCPAKPCSIWEGKALGSDLGGGGGAGTQRDSPEQGPALQAKEADGGAERRSDRTCAHRGHLPAQEAFSSTMVATG